MFDDIGGKIQGLAKVICWIGIIASVITGIAMITSATNRYYTNQGLLWTGIAVMILGSLLSWVGSFTLYGFGELVENSSVIRYELQSRKSSPSSVGESAPRVMARPYVPKDPYAAAAEDAAKRKGADGGHSWTCPYCFAKNPVDNLKCSSCGSPRG